MENKEWVWDNGVIKERDIEEWKKYINEAKRLRLAEAKADVFKKFIEKL
jgi:phage terminase Nu1 subunit (DNA packaging protein)